MGVRVRCTNCGTDQEAATDKAAICQVCGDALVIPAEALSKSATAEPRDTAPAARTEEVYDIEDGSLKEQAAALPEEAPPAKFEEIEEIQAGAKRWTTLSALIPVWGLWRILRSPVHSGIEKLLIAILSIAITVGLGFGAVSMMPTEAERVALTHERASSQIERLAELVERHRLEHGEYPDDDTWLASAAQADLRFYDPWGRIFRYSREGEGFRIGTLGRDGAEGGKDEDADLFSSFPKAGTMTGAVASSRHRHLILDEETCPAVEVGGPVKVNLHGVLHLNSKCRPPLGAIRLLDGASLTVAGGIEVVGGGTNVAASAKLEPPPRLGSAAVTDPLAEIPTPWFDGMTFRTPQNPGGLPVRHGAAERPATLVVKSAEALTPGVYWGGVRIVSGGVATLESGLYVMGGGGLLVLGTGQIEGAGVTIYNTLDPLSPGGIGGYEQILFAESATVALRAPSAGEYRGLVLFQDRSNPRPVELSGDRANVHGLDGTIYAPGAELRITGGPKEFRADLVVGRLTTQSSFTILAPTRALPAG